jgi:hypothetical protein
MLPNTLPLLVPSVREYNTCFAFYQEGRSDKRHLFQQNGSRFGGKIEGSRMERIREEFKLRKKITPQEFEGCLKGYYRRKCPAGFSEEEFKEWHKMSL